MPMLTTLRIALAGVARPRARSDPVGEVGHLVEHARAPRGRRPRRRRRSARPRGARSATCSTARSSVMLIFSPANIASRSSSTPARRASATQQRDRLGGEAVLRVVEVEVADLEAHRARPASGRRRTGRGGGRPGSSTWCSASATPLGRVDDPLVVRVHASPVLGLADRVGDGHAVSAYSSHSSGTPLSSWRPRRVELEPRPGGQVLDGPRDPHLARAGETRDARADVHTDAADVVATSLQLAGVDAGPDLQVELA